jgi:hypothetical protein
MQKVWSPYTAKDRKAACMASNEMKNDVEERRHISTYVLVTLVIIAISSCWSETTPQLSLGRDLRDKIVKDGRNRIPVADLTRFQWNSVCLLTPYRDRLGDDHDMSKLANAELDRLKFVSDEGTWVFIFENNSEITISYVKQSDQADFIGISEANRRIIMGTISGIEPLECANRDEAVFHRTVSGTRTYFILGRDKQ